RRHTRFDCDWSSDVCSSDLALHLSLPSADHDMAALSPVVGPLSAEVNSREPHLFESRRVGLEMVGDELARSKALFLQKLAHQFRSEERRVGKEGRCGLLRCS